MRRSSRATLTRAPQAYLEALTVLHAVVTNFDVAADPGYEPRIRMSLTLPMRDGMPVTVRAREREAAAE